MQLYTNSDVRRSFPNKSKGERRAYWLLRSPSAPCILKVFDPKLKPGSYLVRYRANVSLRFGRSSPLQALTAFAAKPIGVRGCDRLRRYCYPSALDDGWLFRPRLRLHNLLLAVAAATLLGGFWPGILAIVLSALAALYFFMSPLFGFDFNTANAVALAVFITFSGLLVLLVRALNVVVERSLALEETLQTEIERSQRAERDSRHLAAIVEYSDDAILTKDLNGRITSWNRGAERLFGYSADEVVGKPITILIPPERHDEEPGILERVRQGDRVNHYDTVRRRKDGSLIDISLTVSPIKSSDGTISGASSIARDVTERGWPVRVAWVCVTASIVLAAVGR